MGGVLRSIPSADPIEPFPAIFGSPTGNRTPVSRVTGGDTYHRQCHRQGKRTWPDRDSNPGSLAYRASTLTAELPSHTVSPLQFPPAEIDSSPNLLGTMPEPTRQSLCCSQPEHRPPHWPPNVTGKEKERGPTGTRTQGLSLTVRAL